MPGNLPPRSTTNFYFKCWEEDGTLDDIHDALYRRVREQAGRAAGATLGIIDSQSAKNAQKGGSIDPSGFDAGKKTKGRKRHIVVDALGMLLGLQVQPANVQDSIGAFPVMQAALQKHPSLRTFLADGGYQPPQISAALAKISNATFNIVKRPQAQSGFITRPKRWDVERTFAWISNAGAWPETTSGTSEAPALSSNAP